MIPTEETMISFPSGTLNRYLSPKRAPRRSWKLARNFTHRPGGVRIVMISTRWASQQPRSPVMSSTPTMTPGTYKYHRKWHTPEASFLGGHESGVPQNPPTKFPNRGSRNRLSWALWRAWTQAGRAMISWAGGKLYGQRYKVLLKPHRFMVH